jgi:uncharacterized protein
VVAITVLGGTGYAGSGIVREAAGHGHTVVSVSRALPHQQVRGVRYLLASLLDPAAHVEALAGAEVVISALSPRGALREHLLEVNRRLAQLAGQNGARFGVVGGFSALRPAAGAPRFVETQKLPPEHAHEVQTMAAVLVDLESGAAGDVNWFYVSPGLDFGAHVPGRATGSYRLGADVALFDAENRSAISGADFARAVVDEVENPTHHRQHFSVAY